MGTVHKRFTEYPTHRKKLTIMQPEVFEEFNINFKVNAEFNKISICQPYLKPLYNNQLYMKRMSQYVNKK